MLDLARDYFGALNAAGIRYCHWKSNSHLDQALNGQTDLDLLVHHEDESAFRRSLQAFPFIAVQSPPTKTFPFIEDYLGFDAPSGKLLHLHVHYRLILGQRFIKNHHLPIESVYWANLTEARGVAIPVPELELLVLVMRAAMKLGALDALKHAARRGLGRKGSPFPAGIEREVTELLHQASEEKLLRLLAQSGLPLAPGVLLAFIALLRHNAGGAIDYLAFKRYVLRQLRPFRRHRPSELLRQSLEARARGWRPLKSLFPSQKKTLPHGGYAVAVVGADGSGKSTLAADLRKWLSWKLAVRVHYYGIPKSGAIKVLHLLGRVANLVPSGQLRDIVRAMTWAFVARRRAMVSDEIEGDRVGGRVAVIDRFPHPAFSTMARPMDGPQLTEVRRWPDRLFARREATYYRRIRRPDLILVLKAPVEVLRARKSDLAYDTHVAKAEAVMALSEDCATVAVDAARLYADVSLQAKRIIWDRLVARERVHA